MSAIEELCDAIFGEPEGPWSMIVGTGRGIVMLCSDGTAFNSTENREATEEERIEAIAKLKTLLPDGS